MKPLVSIITACYNGEEYVSLPIESILNQTYTNMEYYFIDDGSTDHTKEIVQSYEDAFRQKGISFHYIYKENGGAASAYNMVFPLVKGTYLCAIDSDDFYFPHCIERRVEFLEKHQEFGTVASLGLEYEEGSLEIPIGVHGQLPKRLEGDQFLNTLTSQSTLDSARILFRMSSFIKGNPERKLYVNGNGQNWQMLLPTYAVSKRGFIDEYLFGVQVRRSSDSRAVKSLEEWKNRFQEDEAILVNTLLQIQRNHQVNLKEAIIYVRERFTPSRIQDAEAMVKTSEANTRGALEEGIQTNDIQKVEEFFNVLEMLGRVEEEDVIKVRTFLDDYEKGRESRIVAARNIMKESFVAGDYQRFEKNVSILDLDSAIEEEDQELIAQFLKRYQHVIDYENLKIHQITELCNGCKACQNKCPKKCIHRDEKLWDEKGFWYPKVDASQCVNCKQCEEVCPILNPIIAISELEGYIAVNKDEKVRKESSSGGIFWALGKEIIRREGIVFGACMNEKLEVVHECACTLEELEKFKTSKYVQSDVRDTYQQAKEYLEKGRDVLYTGTPCQIGGLLNYLGKEYENLYCQDLICHGVPSPYIWEKYKEWQQRLKNEKLMRVNFRDKSTGWKKYALNLQFAKSNHVIGHRSDMMMNSFLTNYSIRESCFACRYKTAARASDITLSDYWGMPQEFEERYGGDKGTSLVIVHTSKGHQLYERIKAELVEERLKDETLIAAFRSNPSAILSAQKPNHWKSFMKDVKRINSLPVVTQQYMYGMMGGKEDE